jgi:hypothetical protein
VSQSFGYIPKSGIAGSNGRSMSSFLSSLQIFFQSGCTNLHSVATVLLEPETHSNHPLPSTIKSPKMSPKRSEQGIFQSAPKILKITN